MLPSTGAESDDDGHNPYKLWAKISQVFIRVTQMYGIQYFIIDTDQFIKLLEYKEWQIVKFLML